MTKQFASLFTDSPWRVKIFLFGLLFGISFLFAIKADAIYQGEMYGPSSLRMVLIDKATPVPIPPNGIYNANVLGTVGSVEYPFCVLTADHVADTATVGSSMVVKTIKAYWLRDVDKKQVIAGKESVQPAHLLWRDLSVIWLEQKTDKGDDKRLAKGDFAKYALGKAEDLGYSPVPLGDDSPEAKRNYGMGGYGESKVVPISTDILRKGRGKLVGYSYPFTSTFGGAIVRTNSGTWKNKDTVECGGDSGSNLYDFDDNPGKSFGAFSAGEKVYGYGADKCGRASYGYYTALNSTTASGFVIDNPNDPDLEWNKIGNFEQIKHIIQTTCKRRLSTSWIGNGDIIGTVLNQQKDYNQDELDKDIACGYSSSPLDCVEYIHDPETADLTAYPDYDNGWYFVGWSHYDYTGGPAPIDQCPCHGSTSENCLVPFDDIGTHDSDTSYDISNCVAVFAPYTNSSSSSSSSSSVSSSSFSSSSSSSLSSSSSSSSVSPSSSHSSSSSVSSTSLSSSSVSSSSSSSPSSFSSSSYSS